METQVWNSRTTWDQYNYLRGQQRVVSTLKQMGEEIEMLKQALKEQEGDKQ